MAAGQGFGITAGAESSRSKREEAREERRGAIVDQAKGSNASRLYIISKIFDGKQIQHGSKGTLRENSKQTATRKPIGPCGVGRDYGDCEYRLIEA